MAPSLSENFEISFMQELTWNSKPRQISISKQLAHAARSARLGSFMATVENFNLIEDAIHVILSKTNLTLENQFEFTPDKKQKKDIDNLTAVVKRIRYNKVYNNFARATTDLTLEYIADDETLVDWLSDWNGEEVETGRLHEVADSLLHYQTKAARKCSGIDFPQPAIEFFRMDPVIDSKNNEMVVGGYMSSKSGAKQGSVVLNTHPRGIVASGITFSMVTFHEGMHSEQKFLGSLHADEAYDVLGDFEQAGNLWHHLETTESIVPAALWSSYRAQFHEVAAHDMGSRFQNGLKKIVSATAPKTITSGYTRIEPILA